MKNKKENKKIKKTWIQYGIIAAVSIALYAAGMHTDVLGFVQRGLLATGLMNPNVAEIAKERNSEIETETASAIIPADFNLKLIDRAGNMKSLEDFKGKVIFMNVWATWCPPCIAEMPNINKLHEEMGNEVAFVMISLDEDFETAKEFDERKGYNLPIFALGSKRPTMFNSSSIPTTYIIDADGMLVLTHKGMANYNTTKFKEFLKSLK